MTDPVLELFKRPSSEKRIERPFNPADVPRAQPKAVISDRISLLNVLPSKQYNLRGVDTQCYTIGSVAKVLGKSQITIRSWEQKGWMPLPRVRTAAPASTLPDKTSKGRRLYSRAQVEYLIHAYETCNLDDPKPNWDGFRQLLRNYPQV